MRRIDWLDRLLKEFDAASKRTFAWGEHDCCLFAARCVDAMTGRHFEAELRENYTDETSAKAFLEHEHSLKTALIDRLGQPVPWWKATRGDVCLVPTPDGIGSVGICFGPTIACVSTEKGLRHVPIDKATDCWNV